MLKILIYILFLFAINFSNSKQLKVLSQAKDQNIETIVNVGFSANLQNVFFENDQDESSKFNIIKNINCSSQIILSLIIDFHNSDIYISNSIPLDFYTDLPPPAIV